MSTETAPVAERAPAPPSPSRRRLPSWFGPWEIALAAVLVVVLALATLNSPFFATPQNFAITAAGAIGLALMVVPMTWLMIAGEIDLSVASVFGMCGVVFGLCIESGLPFPLALVLGLVLGAGAGFLNGALTVFFGLPSLVVTVGTLGLYRGVAYILLEARSISSLPVEFTTFAQGNVPGTSIPYTFVLFAVIAIVAGILLHRGSVGRKTYAVGSSATVARFSGIRVRRLKLSLFVFSGTVASLAGMLYAGYVSSARANNGVGLELTVIAIVLIGGVSMFGGRGSMVGVVISLVLVSVLTSWMNLAFLPTNIQNTVIGVLMIAAVVLPALAAVIAHRRRRSARPSA